MAKRQRGRQPEVLRITTAPESRTSDIRHRERRYMISMGIRTLCFVTAVIVGPGFGLYWLMWGLLGASLLLPYVAVVMANSASPRLEGPDLERPEHQYPAIEARGFRDER